jgi:uncharacterized protein (DUF983 family)
MSLKQIIPKGNLIYSIIFSKCPKCNEGNIFKNQHIYGIRNFAAMHDHCPVCKQTTMPEPGFYFGAMYVSYGLTVGLGIILGSPMLLLDFSAEAVIIAISAAIILLSPLIFRWSRMIWFNMFYHYDPSLNEK